MNQLFKRLVREEEAATAIEYGLIAGLIAVALVATLTNVRVALVAVFTSIVNAL